MKKCRHPLWMCKAPVGSRFALCRCGAYRPVSWVMRKG